MFRLRQCFVLCQSNLKGAIFNRRSLFSEQNINPTIYIQNARRLATSSEITPEEEQEQRFKKLIETFRSNPELRKQLDEFQSVLQKKNLNIDAERPSVVQLFKIMMDKDVKESLGKLKKAMEDANISLNKDDVNAVMGILGWKK